MLTQRQLFHHYLGLPTNRPMGLEITHAKGIYIYDCDGKEYIDLVSGVAVSNLGHSHPVVVNAVKEQAEKYMHLMVYGEYIQAPQIKLAELLASFLPERLQCTYFVNSGSEAVEGALKLAKRFTGRTEMIAFKNAYHGGTCGALSVAGDERMKNAFRPLIPDVRLLEFNKSKDLEQITGKTACVIVETIQAEAGIILPVAGFLGALRNRCDETGTLLIVDDIQMGIGRTGKMFSFEHYGIVPDILCLAKAFGGGMPLGAFISSRVIMQSFAFNPEFGHITTFGGHPVSCAASLASLKYIDDYQLYKTAETKGKIFYDRLTGHLKIKEIRYKGLMMGIEMESPELCFSFSQLLLRHGIVVDHFLFRPQAFRIAPPLIITEDEIHHVCDVIISCM